MASVDSVSVLRKVRNTSLTLIPSQPYPYLAKDTVALLGDAGHPVSFI